jgi:hypothetical protein
MSYEQDQALRHKLRNGLAQEIGNELGEGWVGTPDAWHSAELHGPDGMRLDLDVSRTRGSLHIQGMFRHLKHAADIYMSDIRYPGINVSVDRGAVVIAREIKRRLMPDYLHAFAAVQSRIKRYEQMLRERGEMVEWIAGITKTEPHAHGEYVYLYPRVGPSTGKIRIDPGGHVSIEIAGDFQDLGRILAGFEN